MRFPSRSRVRSRETRSPPNTMARSAVIRSKAKWKLAGTARLRVIGKRNAKQKRNRQPPGLAKVKEAVAAKARGKVVGWALWRRLRRRSGTRCRTLPVGMKAWFGD